MKRLIGSSGVVSLVLPAFALAGGCATLVDVPGENEGTFALTEGDISGILWLVNDRRTTAPLLDDEVGLDTRAATNIVTHRDGPDGAFGTSDDDAFGTLEELDAVPYVGAVALQQLLDWLVANPPPSPELVEGILFSGDEAAAVVWGVNQSALEELDLAVGLDARAATNLFAARPYASVAAMGAVAWIGASALASLRAYAPSWEAAMFGETAYAGTFDGVPFDVSTAAVALEIANDASHSGLVGAGMWSGGADAIVSHRPYADLAAVAAASGVGPSTMQALHDIAASGAWPFPGGACSMSLAPSADPAAAAYDAFMTATDTCPLPRWDLAAFDAGCVDLGDPTHVAALTNAMITHSGWTSWAVEFPQMFTYGAPLAGAGGFRTSLDWSLQWIVDTFGAASPQYSAAAAAHAGVAALLEANPTDLYSLSIHIEASEASEDAYLVVDLSTGLVLVMHEGWGC